ncbi:FecR family protein [Desertivirga arenae]|uniref:FecR family protein n=1 Tax=Desertivirga arenae TaxID=2810309 RepID=UPI001A96E332|nr:FecR domain-containing protein [Pedobacter sp. SYSU D00823]
MDQTNFYKQLVDRYLNNQASAEEMEVLFHLLKTGEIDNALKAQLEEDIATGKANHEQFGDLNIQEVPNIPVRSLRPSKPFAPRYLRIAASFIIVAAAALLLYKQKTAVKNLVEPAKYVTAAAENGKVRKLILDDGSVVWLNSGSRLRYPEKFNRNKRELELEGEAFFEVFHDPKKPFIIHSGRVNTTVLGTSFNVKSYKNEYSQITVRTGKVAVSEDLQFNKKPLNPKPVMLTPAQQVTYSPGAKFVVKTNVSTDQFASWKDGDLVFTGKTLFEMKPVLERWYNVKITYENPQLGKCSMIGSYHQESLKNILEAMKFSVNIKYRIEGNKVFISGGNCSSTNK